MATLLEKLAAGATLSLELGGFLLCLFASLLASVLAELMYALFYEQRATGSQVHRSFLLLGPSITFLFISVQLSLPLSLGLLGALSIVRFRTPIKEPEEIGFLMLLIAGAIGIATFRFAFVAILYAAAFLALALRRWTPLRRKWMPRREGVLLVNLSDDVYEARHPVLTRKLAEVFRNLRVESISSAQGSTSIQYVFSGTTTEALDALQRDLRAEVPYRKFNIFFSHPDAAT